MTTLNGLPIMLVDDDPLQLRLLSVAISWLGADCVETFTSGREALAHLDAGKEAGLVFLDLNMPGMDGVEFLRHLVERKFDGALVLVSGEDEFVLDTASRLASAYHLKVLGAISKPVRTEAIGCLLQREHARMPVAGGGTSRQYAAIELGQALLRGQLINLYQPKVDIRSGRLTGVECLVRWQHPEDGLIGPDAFVPLAEEHGLIDELTRAVLYQALADVAQWRREGLELKVSVNISIDNLTRLTFPDMVSCALASNGVAARDLILEVTESQPIRDPLTVLDILTRLRLKHIGLSIDDFGTGHSSLKQLRDYPFDELKIDRGFVCGAYDDAVMRAIYLGSLDMARQLTITTVAEGVETVEDWAFVRDTGCALAQGYFIARPMIAGDLKAWSARWSARFREMTQ